MYAYRVGRKCMPAPRGVMFFSRSNNYNGNDASCDKEQHGRGARVFVFRLKNKTVFICSPLHTAGCSSTVKILTYGGRRRRKTVGRARDHMCLCLCVSVYVCMYVCVSIEKRVSQLFMVKRDLKTTVCPSDRERLRRRRRR
uniref:Uncharacterized protein n=1 Tax=Schizaphis graminum TaxID=13262 RepID=A0A2S2PEY6_SCHGA